MTAPVSDVEKVARAIEAEMGPVLSTPERMDRAIAGRKELCDRLANAALSAVGDRQWNEAIEAAAEVIKRYARQDHGTAVTICDLAATEVLALRRPARGEG